MTIKGEIYINLRIVKEEFINLYVSKPKATMNNRARLKSNFLYQHNHSNTDNFFNDKPY